MDGSHLEIDSSAVGRSVSHGQPTGADLALWLGDDPNLAYVRAPMLTHPCIGCGCEAMCGACERCGATGTRDGERSATDADDACSSCGSSYSGA